MNNKRTKTYSFLGGFCLLLGVSSCTPSKEIQLFDGESFSGWEGANSFFSIQEGAIVAGNLKKANLASHYLCTLKKFENFELNLKVKLKSTIELVSGGVSFRAARVPNSTEVSGYQADIGYLPARFIPIFSNKKLKDTTGIYPLWGALVDENRTNLSRYPNPEIFPVVLLQLVDKEWAKNVVKPNDWNELNIRAFNEQIQIKLNGQIASSFSETLKVPTTGCICLQDQIGASHEVWYKDITIESM